MRTVSPIYPALSYWIAMILLFKLDNIFSEDVLDLFWYQMLGKLALNSIVCFWLFTDATRKGWEYERLIKYLPFAFLLPEFTVPYYLVRSRGWLGTLKTTAWIIICVVAASYIMGFVTNDEEVSGAPVTVKILEYGEYSSITVDEIESENTSLGAVRILGNLKLVKRTADIQGLLGKQFGIQMKVEGDRRKKTTFLVKIHHPPFTNPETNKESSLDEWPLEAVTGWQTCVSWTFEYPWEIKAGEWRIEVWNDDEKLAEKSFNVYVDESSSSLLNNF